MGGKRGLLLYIAFGEKMESVENLGRKKNKLVSTFTLIHASNANNPHPNCAIKTRLNKCFCRNWAIRNPAGTMLDSLAW